ncbi:DUF4255 domain-containing protein [Paraburkholderia sp. BR14427]|uniref:DUF4255 domain-containing protein n=2 Tax=unclassified Paraburkholderia TaxID=2615204 RepID=UPI0034CE5E74
MSDFRAIGGVSATLRSLLTDRMELPVNFPGVPVTIGPPPFSALDNNPRLEPLRINLFLYRVSENGYLQNQEIPGRGNPGAYGHPPLSLNLHYLVTAHGNEETQIQGTPFFDDTHAQYLLGSAMRVLHDVPIITDSIVTRRDPSGVAILDLSLRDEYERIKITLEPLTLEDLTKLWTALTLRMRLAAAYAVNVVQIESRRERVYPRPVGQPASWLAPPQPGGPPTPGPMISVIQMRSPMIASVSVRRANSAVENPLPCGRIGANDVLVLRGTSLQGPRTYVSFGDVLVPASYADPTRVEAPIPDTSVPGAGAIDPAQRLQPGVVGVKAIVRDPRVPGGAFSSNEASFMLVPMVDPASLGYVAGLPRQIAVNGERLSGPAPRGQTMIGRAVVPSTDYLSATPKKIVVPVPDSLPAAGVQCIVGATLADPVLLGAGVLSFDLQIAGNTRPITANLPAAIPRDDLAALLAARIHDAANGDALFLGTRVDLWHERLLIVPGGLTSAIAVTPGAGSNFAAALGLVTPQPPGAGRAWISGALPAPALTAGTPRIAVTIGAQPPVVVRMGPAASLTALADVLQSALQAASPLVEYKQAQVGVSGTQLLVIPGSPGLVRFDAVSGDVTTVVELQLHARFAVRVRVNDAESFDDASVELPQ